MNYSNSLNNSFGKPMNKESNDMRLRNRHNDEEKHITDQEVQRILDDFQSGLDILQLHSLKVLVAALESNDKNIILKKYGNELICLLLEMSEYGLTPEIQSIALICVSLCYTDNQLLDVRPISQKNYIEFLFRKLGIPSLPDINSALHILAVVAKEDEDSIQYMLNIFNVIPQLPSDCGFGELIDEILQQTTNLSPEVEPIVSLIPHMLSSGNRDNICHGLYCVGTLISREWNCFDFESFHSNFHQFLVSDDPIIVSTAFSLLEKFPPSDDDVHAIFQCLSKGGDNSFFALKYLNQTVDVWRQNPSPDLFNCIISCISNSKYNIVNRALSILLPALAAPGIEFSQESVELLTKFLADHETAKFVLVALKFIWGKIQSSQNNDWFIEILAQHDEEIADMISYGDENVAAAAQELLGLMY